MTCCISHVEQLYYKTKAVDETFGKYLRMRFAWRNRVDIIYKIYRNSNFVPGPGCKYTRWCPSHRPYFCRKMFAIFYARGANSDPNRMAKHRVIPGDSEKFFSRLKTSYQRPFERFQRTSDRQTLEILPPTVDDVFPLTIELLMGIKLVFISILIFVERKFCRIGASFTRNSNVLS